MSTSLLNEDVEIYETRYGFNQNISLQFLGIHDLDLIEKVTKKLLSDFEKRMILELTGAKGE